MQVVYSAVSSPEKDFWGWLSIHTHDFVWFLVLYSKTKKSCDLIKERSGIGYYPFTGHFSFKTLMYTLMESNLLDHPEAQQTTIFSKEPWQKSWILAGSIVCSRFQHWKPQCCNTGEITNLNKNTPGVKKERPRTKRALLKKIWNRNGRPRPPAFDRTEIFDMTPLQNIVISGAQGLLMLLG